MNKYYLVMLCAITSFFSLKATAQHNKYQAIVALDGSGDYISVQEAINAAPSNSTKPWVIFIKPGTYKGHIEIPEDKPFLYLIGKNRSSVKITDDRLCGGDNKPTYHPIEGATLVDKASDTFLQGITFENSWGVTKKSGPQALALYTCGDRTTVNNCNMLSYQDTYLTTMKPMNRHYINQCTIEGAVDFIYGCGDVVFDKCKIKVANKSEGYIVAPCHPDSTKWGYVFLNSTITADGNPSETSIWLGRPWHQRPRTVFIRTLSLVTIPEEGWFDHMDGLPKIWADYKTMNADGKLLNLTKRRKTYYRVNEKKEHIYMDAINSLSDDDVIKYSVNNILAGNDGWNPESIISNYCDYSD